MSNGKDESLGHGNAEDECDEGEKLEYSYVRPLLRKRNYDFDPHRHIGVYPEPELSSVSLEGSFFP